MTKREWLESVDFNKLTLKDKIEKCIYFVDNTSVKQFRDKGGDEDEEEYNKLFKAEFDSVFEKYPLFKVIISEIKILNKSKGPDGKWLYIAIDKLGPIIYSKLLKESREETLEEILK